MKANPQRRTAETQRTVRGRNQRTSTSDLKFQTRTPPRLTTEVTEKDKDEDTEEHIFLRTAHSCKEDTISLRTEMIQNRQPGFLYLLALLSEWADA